MTETARALVRNVATSPCPICGGHVGLPQHRGVRCAGFTLDRVAYCTREEYAGALPFDISLSPGAYKHALFGSCGCGASHGWQAILPPPLRTTTARAGSVPLSLRNQVYTFALGLLALRDEALADLTARGLSAAAALAAGFRSIPRRGREHWQFMQAMKERFGEETLRSCPGFTDKNDRLAFWTASGERDGYTVAYADEEDRITGLQLKVLGAKCLTARGTRLYDVYHIAGRMRPGADLYASEGATKAIVAHALGGITIFAVAGQALSSGHIATIRRLQPGRVIVALDREDNRNTDLARERWLKDLHAAGLPTYVAIWEGDDVGGPKGLDDLVAAGGGPRVRAVSFVPPKLGERRTPREVEAPGAVEAGTTLAAVRALTERAIGEFVTEARHHTGEALLVRTPPGAGKTTATAHAIADSGTLARVVVGTISLARELADEHGYALIEGRSADNCERNDVVQALAADGHNIEALACGSEKEPRCPFRVGCRYWEQFQSIGTRVAAAEQLYNPRFLQGGSLVVVDDADLVRSTIQRTRLSEEVLARSHELLAGKRRTSVRRLLAILRHAVVDAREEASKARAPLIGAAAWDHLARTARRNGEDLRALIGGLPKQGTLPEPGATGSVLSVADVQAAPPASILALVDTLREELPAFLSREDLNSRIRVNADGIDVWRLRDHAADRFGNVIIADKPLLLLEATPVPALVARLTRLHRRLPDVEATIALPANVTIVQHAGASNGHTILRDTDRRRAVLAEVAGERERTAVAGPRLEAAICFKSDRQAVIGVGFAEEQVLTFGSVRGSNAVAGVERLHMIGRPMAPADDVAYLAQVVHHDEAPIARQLVLQPRRYGAQPYEVDVVEFADERASALLCATRDDEIVQVIHRARLLTLDPQGELFEGGRRHVRLVLHTAHPIPGLRVDELHLQSLRTDLNTERRDDAERRIRDATAELLRCGEAPTVTAIAKLAGAHKRTVTTVLGTPVHTLRDSLNRGVHRVPQSDADAASSASRQSEAAQPDGVPCCRGGCGTPVPYSGAKCAACADAGVAEWRASRGKRRAG